MCPTTMSQDSWGYRAEFRLRCLASHHYPVLRMCPWSIVFLAKHGWISDEFCATILQKFAVYQETLLLTKHPMSWWFLRGFVWRDLWPPATGFTTWSTVGCCDAMSICSLELQAALALESCTLWGILSNELMNVNYIIQSIYNIMLPYCVCIS